MTDASVTEKAAAAAKDVADDVSAGAKAVADDASKAASTASKDVAASTRDAQKAVEKKVEKAADTVSDTARTAKGKAQEVVEGETDDKPVAPPARSLEEIESELDATRERLAGRIDDLKSYVAPRNVADRQMQKVKGVFVDEFGGIKPDRVAMAIGVVAVLVGIRVLRRRRRS